MDPGSAAGASVTAIFHQMYSCPNVRSRETFAYVNLQAMQSFRAPGHVEGAFALERAMDTLAARLGVDPLELRRRNLGVRDEHHDRPYSSNQLGACYDQGAARFGWASREARRNAPIGDRMVRSDAEERGIFRSGGGPNAATARPVGQPQPPARWVRGFGLAAQSWPAGGGPPAYATVRLNSDASIDVLSGTQDLGTGTRTVLAQIAADALGAALSDVRVILGDTERTPYAGPSWGSMTVASVGPAVRAAAEQARRKLLDAASELLLCPVDDLLTSESVVTSRDGAHSLRFADITKRLGHVMISAHGSRGPNPQGVGLTSFGVQFAEVLVDAALGIVRVVRIVAVHDVGRVINPLLAQSQVEGGILQGLGFALTEERVIDAVSGLPVNPSLHDYKIPGYADAPIILTTFIDNVDIVANHIGARGLAEPPIIPTAPAIANAVADALGVEINALPLTPWRVLDAVRHST